MSLLTFGGVVFRAVENVRETGSENGTARLPKSRIGSCFITGDPELECVKMAPFPQDGKTAKG